MSLSNEQLLLLDALTYYPQLSDKTFKDKQEDMSEDTSIEKFIDSIRKNKENYHTVFNGTLGYTDKDLGMDKIIELVDNDTTLKNLVIVYPERSADKTTSSVCLVDPTTSEVYVIFAGNYAENIYKYIDEENNVFDIVTWIENGKGAMESDTAEQRRELDFYNNAIAAARDYLQNQDGDLDITVSGHSAGGNHAQYVTTVYKTQMGDDYKAVNDIDRCVSFDGQGFLNAFLDDYQNDIIERVGKIITYCPTISFVGELLNKNGHFKAEAVASMEYILLHAYVYVCVAIMKNYDIMDSVK